MKILLKKRRSLWRELRVNEVFECVLRENLIHLINIGAVYLHPLKDFLGSFNLKP